MPVYSEMMPDFDQRIEQVVSALDEVRKTYGVEPGVYEDDGREDGPGAFFMVTDRELEHFTRDAFDQARRKEYDQLKACLEEEPVSSKTYDLFQKIYDEEFGDDDELRVLGDTYLGDIDPEEIDDEELYDRIYRTFEENDGAAVYGSDGFSDVTYDIPKLDFDGTARGTKEATARGVVENTLYMPDGEEIDVRVVTLSETDGTIKVYGPEGFTEYGKNTPVPTFKEDEREGIELGGITEEDHETISTDL